MVAYLDSDIYFKHKSYFSFKIGCLQVVYAGSVILHVTVIQTVSILMICFQGGAAVTRTVAEDVRTLLGKRGLPYPLV